jgi:hypothetical protein
MMEQIKLGSLFSGSGGFELGAILAGIRPVWNSEIEPFPIRVTTRRLPSVKHYGDVSAVNGAQIEPVDIITFGSPCQDMSIAGKRDGLGGSQSSLFYQAVRIVKEMREETNGQYPRYIVWENVPGAFSSNKGEDFRTVLEEICRIKDLRFQWLAVPDGSLRDASWETGTLWPGASSMPNTGASPSEESASTLSQILMDKVPERFYLSPRACQGILRRASEHGRVLPDVLRLALERQAQSA